MYVDYVFESVVILYPTINDAGDLLHTDQIVAILIQSYLATCVGDQQ